MGSCFEIFILNAHAITRRSFYLVSAQVKALFSQPLIQGVQASAPWNKPEFFKTWGAVSKNSFLLSSELPDVFTTSDSRWDKSSIFGKFAEIYQKFEKHQVGNNQHQKRVFVFLVNFRKFLLISWCWTLLSQPLFWLIAEVLNNKEFYRCSYFWTF